jgi:hypothetical protein
LGFGNVGPKTIERYRELEHHVRPHIGAVRLQSCAGEPVSFTPNCSVKAAEAAGALLAPLGTFTGLAKALSWRLNGPDPAKR